MFSTIYLSPMNTPNQHIRSGSPFEKQVGFCRARRIGNHVWVAGTAAIRDGKPYAPGDFYAQTTEILAIITRALAEAGATLHHVVRTRIYVTDIAQWPAVARAHQEVFGGIDPVSTMVEVSALISPDMVVEIEAEALITY